MFGYELDLDKDQIYWLFSSAAQSIAAFIALLLTGYAFVVNVMDNLEVRDETLAEVHTDLKASYYKTLKNLAVIGGSTIIASLGMLFANYYGNWVRSALLIPTTVGIVLTIFIGVLFIIEIVDPQKYKKKARYLLKEEEEKAIHKKGSEVSTGEFMEAFISFERQMRDLYYKTDFYNQEISYKNSAPRSLNELITLFFKAELLHREELELLRELIKTRNFVVHGEQTQIDSSWLDMLNQATDITNNVRKRIQDRTRFYQHDEPLQHP